MTAVQLEDIFILAIVTVAHAYQLATFAMRTGKARMKYKIYFPAVSGNVDFERIYRAQMNTLEFFPIFISAFWMSGLFFHQVPVAVVGGVYMYSRQIYFDGYIKSVEGRLPGFKLARRCIYVFLGMFYTGIANLLLITYLGVNIRKDFIGM